MGRRNYMFVFSALLLVVAIGGLLIQGLTFSIEFQGGTAVNIVDAGDVTIEQVRSAFQDAGVSSPQVQTTDFQGVRGYIVRTEATDPDEAARTARGVAEELGFPYDQVQTTTIGPGWGQNITDRALMALAVSIAAILLYISLRFEYKMSITAVLALVHDVIIVLGIYALVGQEVSPNTIAALLTILGYSLYDTVVVFHRVKENSTHLVKQTFMGMANQSINEVIVRSMNTTITSLLPVLIMLFFGGETLRDFAFALTIGLLIGAYSSIGVATPVYALWKETEPKFAALKKKYANA